MKNLSVSFELPLPLDVSFARVFEDVDVLEAVHGKGRWSATPWKGDNREMVFELEPQGVPAPVLNIIGSGKMSAKVRQTKKVSEGVITVKNRVRPQIVGAELVRIRPTFVLRALDDVRTEVALSCDVCAILPPPFDRIAEEFMKNTSHASFKLLQAATYNTAN